MTSETVVVDLVEKIARAFHDEYEAWAACNGWETQEATRTSFDDLPAENRETMLATVRSLLDRRIIAAPTQPSLSASDRKRLEGIADFLDFMVEVAESHGEPVAAEMRESYARFLRHLASSPPEVSGEATSFIAAKALEHGNNEHTRLVKLGNEQRARAEKAEHERDQAIERVREVLEEQAAEYRREANEARQRGELGWEKLTAAADVVECVTRIIFDSDPEQPALSEEARPDLLSEPFLRGLDSVLGPIYMEDDAPCLDDYRRAVEAGLAALSEGQKGDPYGWGPGDQRDIDRAYQLIEEGKIPPCEIKTRSPLSGGVGSGLAQKLLAWIDRVEAARDVSPDALEELNQLREGVGDRYRSALKAISGPEDSGPWILVYQEAGGGYAGLQAIAEAALEGDRA